MSDEITRPTTYGEKRVRGHLPPTMQFEDPGWWRELGAEIDGYQAEITQLRATVAEYEKFAIRVKYALDCRGDFLIGRLRYASRALNEWINRKAANDVESAGN